MKKTQLNKQVEQMCKVHGHGTDEESQMACKCCAAWLTFEKANILFDETYGIETGDTENFR